MRGRGQVRTGKTAWLCRSRQNFDRRRPDTPLSVAGQISQDRGGAILEFSPIPRCLANGEPAFWHSFGVLQANLLICARSSAADSASPIQGSAWVWAAELHRRTASPVPRKAAEPGVVPPRIISATTPPPVRAPRRL